MCTLRISEHYKCTCSHFLGWLLVSVEAPLSLRCLAARAPLQDGMRVCLVICECVYVLLVCACVYVYVRSIT
jgi:hypothetical protein